MRTELLIVFAQKRIAFEWLADIEAVDITLLYALMDNSTKMCRMKSSVCLTQGVGLY